MVRKSNVNGIDVKFTFDTGADVSTLTEKTSKKLGLVLKQPERQLTGADGSNLKVAGVSEVCIKSTYCCVNAPIYVLSGSKSNLLGMPELRQLNLLAVVNATCTNESDLPTRP